ncbi:MAG: hypothetical protein GY869_16845 [Planctomycetes bacterium]|nr:hypothetical protein [Planctomycetota bacterium]
MGKNKLENGLSVWGFRREVTLGTLLHLAALVLVLVAGWSNLQKELAVIGSELEQLVESHVRLQKHIEHLSGQGLDHEFRLRELEKESGRRM